MDNTGIIKNKNTAKKIVIILLSLCAVMISLTVSVSAATDYENNWAKETISVLIERGIISPVDLNGNIKPDIPITRAEVAAAINKTYGYTQTAPINYKDADPSAWYYKDLQIAKAAGYMIGDGVNVHPNDPISRQELSTVVGRILKLSSGKDYAKTFKDVANIADWSIDYVGALANEKVLVGYPDGTFLPKNNITRAEAYTVILRSEKIFNAIKNNTRNLQSVTVTSNLGDGNTIQNYADVTVTQKGVAINGVVVNGDLIIAKDVADGNITLQNVIVKGITYIYGGGPNSVTATNCNFGYVVLNSTYNTRLLLNGAGKNSISKIIALSSGTIDVQNAVSPNISAAAGTPATAVLNIKGTVNTVDVKSAASVNIFGKASVLNVLSATGTNAKITVSSGASVNTANLSAPVNVTGDGTISTANITSSGVVLSAQTQKVVKNPTVDGTPIISAVFQDLSVTGTNSSNGYIQLTATFDKGINDGLTSGDVGVKGAALVSVTGSGKTYVITVSNVTATTVYVTVQKAGYSITSATKSVNAGGNTINFKNLTADGSSNTITTQLTITFDKTVPGLTVNDITVTGATKGILTGNGPIYYLSLTDIAVVSGQSITVRVYKNNYVFTPDTQTVTVYKSPVTFGNLAADGSDTQSTSQLTITLSTPVPGLSVNDFAVTGATKGSLTQSSYGTGNIYYLTISNITVLDRYNVTVKIAKTGYIFTPDTLSVTIRKLPDISFATLTAADGSDSLVTTTLNMTFGIAALNLGLTVNDFTVTGASKGYLTQTATSSTTVTYTLTISAITVADKGTVTVAVARYGYNFAPNSRDVVVRKPLTSPVYVSSITAANGSSSSPASTTTLLNVTLDRSVPGLAATDFTINGAKVGTLSSPSVTGSGTVLYTLGISNITVGNMVSITVTITKAGYTFYPNVFQVPVYVADSFTFNSVTQIGGSATAATTQLVITLSKSIPNLLLSDITITRPGGGGYITPTNLVLTQSGSPGKYTLYITPVATETVTVTISKSGYTITSPSQTVQVYKPAQNITYSYTSDGNASTTTTKIVVTLGTGAPTLSAGDFTVSGTAKVTTGLISISGNVYTIPVTVNTAGTAIITPSKTGYTFTSNTAGGVSVYKAPDNIAVTYAVRADGSASATTTEITITLSTAVPTLTDSDITLLASGAGAATVIKGTGSNGGTTYAVPITVTNAGTVTVSITKTGYTFTPLGSNTVQIYKAADNVTVTGITVSSPSTDIEYGGTPIEITLTAEISPEDATNTGVIWTIISDANTIATLDSYSGISTNLIITGAGEITVRAISAENSAIHGDITITVTEP
ncbi:MAG: S-layer homology domain-containing protein [Oscillospiraceae bacterium]|nr:S-layer homology domain-containing protein [Oscillospiraceae bacterium]